MSSIVGMLYTYYGYLKDIGMVIFCIKGAISLLKDVNSSSLESGIHTLFATGGNYAIFASLPEILDQIKRSC